MARALSSTAASLWSASMASWAWLLYAIASSRRSVVVSSTATASAAARTAPARSPVHQRIRESHRRLAPSVAGVPDVRRSSTAAPWSATALRCGLPAV